MKTIGIISPYPSVTKSNGDLGAMGWYTSSLIKEMPIHTKESIVVFASTNDERYSETQDNITIDFCWKKNSFLFFWNIYKQIISHKDIKVVHIQHEFSVFGNILTNVGYNILLLLLKLKGIYVIQTEHGIIDPKIVNKEFVNINNLPFPSRMVVPFFQVYFLINNLFVNKQIVHEEYFKYIFSKHYFISERKISVIPIGVNQYQKLDQDYCKKKLGIDKDKKVLLYFGYIAGYKGLDLLIDAYKYLSKTNEDYFLIIAGGMPKRTSQDLKYISRYDKLQIDMNELKNCIRVGYVADEDISTYFGASNLLIMPYKYMLAASGPMSLSIAYGLPFVVSKVFDPIISYKDIVFNLNKEDLAKCIESNILSDKNNSYIQDLQENRSRTKIAKQTSELYI